MDIDSTSAAAAAAAGPAAASTPAERAGWLDAAGAEPWQLPCRTDGQR